MGRQARLDLPGFWYHVTVSGQPGKKLFRDDLDRLVYLRVLNLVLQEYKALCAGYVLLTTHLHLIIKRNEITLGNIFKRVNTKYAIHYNNKYKTRGRVFRDRPFSRIILKEKYLAAVIRYIHRENPLKAGLARTTAEYKWSSDKYYRTGIQDENIVLVRAPSFKGKPGSRKYLDLVDDKDRELLIPGDQHFIGTEKEFDNIEKRCLKWKWYREDRRKKVPLKKRVRQLCENYQRLKLVRSRTRYDEIVKDRKRIIRILMEEGYMTSEIARYFRRTIEAIRYMGKPDG